MDLILSSSFPSKNPSKSRNEASSYQIHKVVNYSTQKTTFVVFLHPIILFGLLSILDELRLLHNLIDCSEDSLRILFPEHSYIIVINIRFQIGIKVFPQVLLPSCQKRPDRSASPLLRRKCILSHLPRFVFLFLRISETACGDQWKSDRLNPGSSFAKLQAFFL